MKGMLAAALAGQAALFVCVAIQCRTIQQRIENEGRRAIGELLRKNAQPNDTILLEPLGYVGYFSQLKMLDYPGLAAPEVTAALRAGARTWPALVAKFKPNWVLLRPREYAQFQREKTTFSEDYSLALTFDATRKLDQQAFLPGRDYARYDSVFYLFRKNPPKPAPAAPAPPPAAGVRPGSSLE